MFKAIKKLIEKNNSGKLKSRKVGFIVVLKSGPDPLIGTEYIRKIVANVVPEFSPENITNDFTAGLKSQTGNLSHMQATLLARIQLGDDYKGFNNCQIEYRQFKDHTGDTGACVIGFAN